MVKIKERRKQKRIYDILGKWSEHFNELTYNDLTKIGIDHIERIFLMEIKTDLLLDKTHEW